MKCRPLLCWLFLSAATAAAQTSQPEKKQSDASFALPDGTQPIRLTIGPAPAPVPALKYRLLPDVRDLKPGNSVMLYYRAFSPDWQINRHPETAKAMGAWVEDTRQVPPKELHTVLTANSLKEMDLGARRAYVDWQLNERVRREGIYMLLPDIQSFRTFAVMLSARARLETADGHHDKALFTLQTGLKLGRDIADAPTLIQTLVGMAVCAQMFVQAEELIQSPGSPNLYWALTDLPRPFINMQTPYQGERLFIDNLFPGMREILADKNVKPLPEDEVRAIADKLVSEFGHDMGIVATESDWEVRLGMAALVARSYPEARRFLLALGRSKQQVDAMSMLQAVMLLEVHNFDRFYDEFMKWETLPYWQARKGMVQAEASLKQAKVSASAGTLIATLLLPAMLKVQSAAVRTERRIAALRVVEALRLHVASHAGGLPSSLQEVTDVPVPLDPMTGTSFRYRVQNGRATLLGPAPSDETPNANNVLVYELTLKRR